MLNVTAITEVATGPIDERFLEYCGKA